MNSLAAYASEDEDEDEDTPKRKASPPKDDPPRKKRKLPSLPSSLTPPIPESDPSQHQGRTRTHPHVEGQFASYVYVPVPLEGQLRKLVKSVFKHAKTVAPTLHAIVGSGGAGDEPDSGELHISLSRPVYLRHHQREAFKNAVKAIATKHAPFSASLATFATFNNDEHTRGFLSLEVGAGHANLRDLADTLTPTIRGLYQKEYYAQPRFHASLGWALLHHPDAEPNMPSLSLPHTGSESEAVPSFPSIAELPPGLLDSLTKVFAERLRQHGGFDVGEVRVRIGREVKVYSLSGRG